MWMPLMLLGLALGLSLLFNTGPLAFLAWFPLVGVFVYLSVRLKARRALEARVREVHELALLRRWDEALRGSWRLLPDLYGTPDLHARTVLAMAHCLDQVGGYDASLVAYDHLLQRVPRDHPAALSLRLQRAMVLLGNERLSDADDALRALRGALPAAPSEGSPIHAGYRWASLLQHASTHHFEDALAEEPGLIEALRPLGVEAGYGYALMAYCRWTLSQRSQGKTSGASPEQPATPNGAGLSDPQASGEDGHLEAAARWWGHATTLVAPASILNRYPNLRAMSRDPMLVEAAARAAPPWSGSGSEVPR
jgi:tetratricopeptide (TPR) repeat protein